MLLNDNTLLMDRLSQTTYPKTAKIKEGKIFPSFQSKITSAQNHEYLKLYESSVDYYKKSNEINTYLLKTQLFTEEPDLQLFQKQLANQLNQKINLVNILKKVAQKETESETEENTIANDTKEKEGRILTINDLISKSKTDLVELQNSIKLFNPSTMIESRTIINEKSFVVTQIQKNTSQSPPSQLTSVSQSTIEYLEKLVLKYKQLIQSLTKLLVYYNKKNTLIEEKEEKKKELELLKKQYDELKPKHDKTIKND